jgi:ubiquinone/menaquinone biosynthesis C-methylase UbiE
MSNRVRKQWEALGKSDPYWAVLSLPDKKGARWDKEQFFHTGVVEIDDVYAKLVSLAVTPRRAIALDYGCGVGRLSRALSPRFDRVIAVDISASMLQEARTANRELSNIEFVHGSGRDLATVADRSIDFVYSNIVLQHSTPRMQRRLIAELCRVVAPGGVLVFQTPSHANLGTVSGALQRVLGNRVLNVARRVLYGKDGVMELHALARREVEAILRAGGATLLEAQRFDSAGAAFVSYRYFCVRR